MIEDKQTLKECKEIFERIEHIVKILTHEIIDKKTRKDDDVNSVLSRSKKMKLFASMYTHKIERILKTNILLQDKNNIINMITQTARNLETLENSANILLISMIQGKESDEIFNKFQDDYTRYINKNDEIISKINKYLH